MDDVGEFVMTLTMDSESTPGLYIVTVSGFEQLRGSKSLLIRLDEAALRREQDPIANNFTPSPIAPQDPGLYLPFVSR